MAKEPEKTTDARKAATKATFDEADAKAQPEQTPREKRDALNAEFEKADDEGKAAIIAETQAGLGVRGY